MIKVYIEWLKHFFWLIGWSFWCLIQLDIDNCIDTLFWLKIHLTYQFSVSTENDLELSKKQKIINFFVILAGIFISAGIISLILNLFKTILLYGKG